MLTYNGYKNQWWADGQTSPFTDSTEAAQRAANIGAKARISSRQNKNGKRSYRVHYYDGSFHAEGILGQFVYVNPAKGLVIVRLGHNWSHPGMYARGFIYQVGNSF
jgi:CubicO group peptidase (beta-lactamase class C family)